MINLLIFFHQICWMKCSPLISLNLCLKSTVAEHKNDTIKLQSTANFNDALRFFHGIMASLCLFSSLTLCKQLNTALSGNADWSCQYLCNRSLCFFKRNALNQKKKKKKEITLYLGCVLNWTVKGKGLWHACFLHLAVFQILPRLLWILPSSGFVNIMKTHFHNLGCSAHMLFQPF